MKRNTVILLVLLSFILAGPAMAVKRVPKSNDKVVEGQKGNADERPPERGPQPAPPPSAQMPPRSESPREPERPAKPDKPAVGERDRFIDENGDGLNDRIKMPPETIKKKRETKSDRSDKSDKERRAR